MVVGGWDGWGGRGGWVGWIGLGGWGGWGAQGCQCPNSNFCGQGGQKLKMSPYDGDEVKPDQPRLVIKMVSLGIFCIFFLFLYWKMKVRICTVLKGCLHILRVGCCIIC